MRSLPRPASLEWSRPRDAALLSESGAEPKPQPRDEAKALLLEQLEAGIAKRTLARAVRELGIVVFKEPGIANGRWMWRLPTSKAATATPTGVAAFEEDPDEQPKAATAIHTEVAAFDDPADPAKAATATPTEVAALDDEPGEHAKAATAIHTDVAALEATPVDQPASPPAATPRPVILRPQPKDLPRSAPVQGREIPRCGSE